MSEVAQSRAERLDAIVRRVAPRKVAYYAEHGVWPTDADLETDPPTPPAASIDILAQKLARADQFTTPTSAHRAQADAIVTRRRQAPYTIQSFGERRRITVIGDDGDTLTGTGKGIDAAVAALEAKLS